MSKRFQHFSKYRNSVLTAARREEWYALPPASASTSGEHNPVKSNGHHIAFRSGSGSLVNLVNLNKTGKLHPDDVVSLNHGCLVSDIDFGPAQTLASAGDDGLVKLWSTSGADAFTNLSTLNSGSGGKRVESVLFHPTADGILSLSTGSQIQVWNIHQSTQLFQLPADESPVQHFAWSLDGSLLAAATKDNSMRIYDPRGSTSAVSKGLIHDGIKPSRLVWVDGTTTLFSTGFNKKRDREYALWDTRNASKPLVLNRLDTSPGIVTPLYDPDTSIVFLAGKGDTTVKWVELKAEDPYVTAGLLGYSGKEVLSGGCMIPKYSTNVMACEIARLLLLGSDGTTIVPVSCTVPRKTNLDFHSDIFPDTRAPEPVHTIDSWMSKEDRPARLISLDPKKRTYPTTPSTSASIGALTTATGSLGLTSGAQVDPTPAPIKTVPVQSASLNGSLAPRIITVVDSGASPARVPLVASSTVAAEAVHEVKPIIAKHSNYRFVTGKAVPKFTDLRQLNVSLPIESNFLEVSDKLIAFPITGPGGRIAVIRADQPKRFDPKIPAVLSGSDVTSFKFDPFDGHKLVAGSDDGKIRIWQIPEKGLSDDSLEPTQVLSAHGNRVLALLFHPIVKDVLLSASIEQDGPKIKIWNMQTLQATTQIPLPDLPLGVVFSLEGDRIVAACRDKIIRIYDALTGALIKEGPSHDGTKGCRLAWLAGNTRFVTVGYGRTSTREVRIYDVDRLSGPIYTLELDISPSLLIPHFDEDTSLLYLVGRGESFIQICEVSKDQDSVQVIARFDGSAVQQGLGFLSKRQCNVAEIEIAVGWRLTSSGVESISFTVPRLKKEYFQDDIFTPTRVTWEPLLTALEWIGGQKKEAKYLDLRPNHMTPISQAVAVQPSVPIRRGPKPKELTEDEKKSQLLSQMRANAIDDDENEVLQQDKMEGVDDAEWDD
ncbi:uncharacterized protein BJ171DRAFT_491716 [Polychytrium aggregatum]|uniref:uncharacterized protein n=1 Tax=Polychytrium aggregatum TaxID=110093 RepID=UPI0022FE4C76|nr:uncharacterized protein BJ171DRAFT_491716 [Polychytrium aggregatum]KAI9207856.1 hypothetical protein BJ171DRAFT_491716 [Polychytrium aggregatum]